MRLFSAAEIEAGLPFPFLVDALERMFRRGGEAPLRHHHEIRLPDKPPGTLLLMPAWSPDGYAGVKLVSVYPQNGRRNIPTILGTYVLLDAETGAPLAVMDGAAITLRRTAAASLLAARYLARPDSRRLLLCGTGRLAPYVARAYVEVLGIERVYVWGRDAARAAGLATKLVAEGITAFPAGERSEEVASADIVSCVTMSTTPLFDGAWLSPGTHVDLIGGYTPAMREADDIAVQRASVYVDTREGALAEAGDIVVPLRNGVISPDRIRGDLFDLCQGHATGRTDATEITLFKSVGCALEDLAAAQCVWQAS